MIKGITQQDLIKRIEVKGKVHSQKMTSMADQPTRKMLGIKKKGGK